jgi:microcystin-dependent protein
MEAFLGQVTAFAFNSAPRGWMPCDGRQLEVKQYGALFAVIRNTYGGDGKTTFCLPKLGPAGPKGPNYFIAIAGPMPPL